MEDIVESPPDAVLLLVGTNNMSRDSLVVRDMRECSALLRLVKATFPFVPVFMCAVLPRLDRFGQLVKYFNSQLAQTCRAHDITYFDVGSPFMNAPSLFGYDGLHFSAEGYEQLAQGLQLYLEGWVCPSAPGVPPARLPPLTFTKKKSRKQAAQDDVVVAKSVRNHRHRKRHARHKAKKLILVTEVQKDGEHYSRRGWVPLPPISLPPTPLLPIKRHWLCHLKPTVTTKNTLKDLPKHATPYIKTKREGKRRKKRRKRIRKQRKKLNVKVG